MQKFELSILKVYMNRLLFLLFLLLYTLSCSSGGYDPFKCDDSAKKMMDLDTKRRAWTLFKLSSAKKAVDEVVYSEDPLDYDYLKGKYDSFMSMQVQFGLVDSYFQISQAKIAAECAGNDAIQKEKRKAVKDTMVNYVIKQMVVASVDAQANAAGNKTKQEIKSQSTWKQEFNKLKNQLDSIPIEEE